MHTQVASLIAKKVCWFFSCFWIWVTLCVCRICLSYTAYTVLEVGCFTIVLLSRMFIMLTDMDMLMLNLKSVVLLFLYARKSMWNKYSSVIHSLIYSLCFIFSLLLIGRSSFWKHLSLESKNHGWSRQSLCWWRVSSWHPFPSQLSICST